MFRDRYDAGRQLAAKLMLSDFEDPVVLALTRGGVPIGSKVAQTLDAPLDLLVVRKVGAPQNPEFAIGAVAEGGITVTDRRTISVLGIGSDKLEALIEHEVKELLRRSKYYRQAQKAIDITGRTVVITDDGVATGLSDLAAVRAACARGAGRVILAIPVGSPQAVELLRDQADEVVCLHIPRVFDGVGCWYEDFSPVQDAEVLALLTGKHK